MENTSSFDCVVLGAGIEGSATAYNFAKNGKRTLLIEQFALPHSRGSSHGQSRIIRNGYAEPFYVKIMPDCFRLWKQIERESETKLLKRVGFLALESAPYNELHMLEKNFTKFGIRHERLSNEDIMKRYPIFKLNSDYRGILDYEGGILKADNALASLQSLFKQYGGIIHDRERVVDIIPHQHGVTISTSNSLYQSRTVVLTPGPWASSILKPLGLQIPFRVQRVSPCYWREKSPGSMGDQKLPLPVFKDITSSTYGIPPYEYPYMLKYCCHGGVDVESPEYRDRDLKTNIQKDINKLKIKIKENFPLFQEEPCIVEHCMYTYTTDSHPILDRHPKFPNIIIGAGFSGRGFKLAPFVGKMLYELSLNKKPSPDLEPFSFKRFIPGLVQSRL